MAKVDKRSKRTKLKDAMIKGFKDRIVAMEMDIQDRTQANAQDDEVIAILKDQIENINKLCDDGQKAT